MLGGLELVSRIRKHKVKLAPGHELRRGVEYDLSVIQDTVAELKEIKIETQRLRQLYRKIFPKVDPALVYDLISRLELDPQCFAPVYTIEVFTKDGTDAKKSRDHILQTTGTVPSVYDNDTHYVSAHRLTLETLKKLNDIDYVLEVMGDYNGSAASIGP